MSDNKPSRADSGIKNSNSIPFLESSDSVSARDADFGSSGHGDSEQAIDPLDQRLTAYLDGELTDAETEQVETELMTDDRLRTRLRELQATWDMLDELPRGEPTAAFLKSTIELAVASSGRKKTRWHRWPIRIVALAAAFSLAWLIAFQVVRSIQMAPYHEFVEDLDFLANQQMYDQIQDFEFLLSLHESNLFAGANSEGDPIAATLLFDQPNDQQFANMEPREVKLLRNNQMNYQSSTSEKQKKLRSLHAKVKTSENREQLVETMRLYHQWFAKLPTGPEKFAINDLPVQQRIQAVERLRKEQAEQQFGLKGETGLSKADIPAMFKWCHQFCADKQVRMLTLFPENRRENPNSRIHKMKPEQLFVILHMTKPGSTIQLIESQDIDSLRVQLSSESADKLDSLASGDTPEQRLDTQKKLVDRWLFSALKSLVFPQVDHSTLADYMETEMTDEDFQKAIKMSPAHALEFARNHRNARAAGGDMQWVLDPPRRGQRRGRGGRRYKDDPRD